MNITGLVLLGAGYLLGNETAREKFGAMVQQLAGNGIDALNSVGKGGAENASVSDVVSTASSNE